MFAAQGAGASLRAIGDSIGVSHAALRYFFPTRADLTERIRAGQRAGSIAVGIDAGDAAPLTIAASDGLQPQWLLDPDAVDVRRSLALLERLLPDPDRTAAPSAEDGRPRGIN